MSDRVVVMNQGRVEQIADPKTIYAQPHTPFVLGFVGQALRLHGHVEGPASNGQLRVRTAIGSVRARGSFPSGRAVLVAVRPEAVELGPGTASHNSAVLKVRELAFLGSKTQVMFEAAGDDVLMAELPGAPPEHLQPGADAAVRWPIDATLSFLSGP